MELAARLMKHVPYFSTGYVDQQTAMFLYQETDEVKYREQMLPVHVILRSISQRWRVATTYFTGWLKALATKD